MSEFHDAHLAADILRVIVIEGCVLQAYLATKSSKATGTLGAAIITFGAMMLDVFIGGTECLRFGHDAGYWRLYVGALGIYAMSLGTLFRIRELQRSSDPTA